VDAHAEFDVGMVLEGAGNFQRAWLCRYNASSRSTRPVSAPVCRPRFVLCAAQLVILPLHWYNPA
jgi:hypothetical protein